MSHNSIISYFIPYGQKKATAEGRSPPQELEVGLRSGPYVLVLVESYFLLGKSDPKLIGAGPLASPKGPQVIVRISNTDTRQKKLPHAEIFVFLA